MGQILSYRVLKAAWGIAIDLTADKSFPAIKPISGVLITDGLWLIVTVPRISDLDLKWIENGLHLIVSHFKNKPLKEHKHIVVTLSHLETFPCDFQPEGLSDAIIRWSAKEFELEIPQPKISFNKDTNRYLYDFSPLLKD